MTRESLPPRRLLEMDGPAGDCLRNALAEREVTVPRFVVLREKRQLRLRVQRAAALAGLGALAIVVLPKLLGGAPTPSIEAERTAPRAAQPLARVEDAPAPESVPHEARAGVAQPSAEAAPPRLRKVAPTAPVAAEAPSVAAPRPSPSSPQASVASGPSAKACAELARHGAPNDALECYAKLAQGAGMSAELALFEKARLEGKVLRQPARALATLDAYRRRFPNGSLRAEVMLAQLEWSMATGDAARARALVDEALASGLLRERGPELERLRNSLASP